MSNATHGNYIEDTETCMRFYDLLPAALREFNRNCLVQWATGPQFKRLKTRPEVDAYIEHMIMSDVRTVREDARKDWGLQRDAYIEAQRKRRRRDYLDKPPRSRL